MTYESIKSINDNSILEGVITCVNYSDFLDETLAFNLPHFDRLVVVTTHTDKETKSVCTKYSVDCVCTDVFHEDGSNFSKGLAINLGLGHLKCSGWVVHLDADIVLPDSFRQMLNCVGLQKDCIYGADRLNVIGREVFESLKKTFNFKKQFQYKFLVCPAQIISNSNQVHFNTLGSRLLHKEYGYTPIGYFQLWYGPVGRRYPTVQNGSAEHTDVLHSLQWPRSKRILLPNVIVYHLESEKSNMGKNWNGRQTKTF